MNIKKYLFSPRSIQALLLVFTSGFVTTSLAALLLVTPGYPKIDAIDAAGTTSFDLNTMALSVNAKPTAITFNLGDSPGFVFDPTSAKINATLDGTCNVTGGNPNGGFDIEIIGDVYDQNFALIKSGVLLTGDIVEMGFDAASAPNARFDFRFTNAGGQLVTDGDWPLGTDIGVTLNSEGSSFTGNCLGDFAGGAKAIIGPIDAEVGGDVCDVTLVKTASPDMLGPFSTHHNFGNDSDTDSDSGLDHDKSGDTDDSDSDSEADSADSDAGAPFCGCKGRVKQLTLRYNRATANIVEVRRKNGKVLYGPQLLQPGEEFSFAVKGKKIKFLINMEKVSMLKTGCKDPIGAGQAIGSNGDLIVVSGLSKFRNPIPLCPFPGTSCSVENEVTYTYEVTNNGTGVTDVVLFDDQIGVIGSVIPAIPGVADAPANVVTVQTTSCIFKDTINKAVAIGLLGGGVESCESNEAQATVTVDDTNAGTCPYGTGYGDSDSDSGIDYNQNSDTDDSDSDSGPMDCDKDEKRSCFGTGDDTDSDSGIDHNKNGDSDDSDSDSGPLDCDADSDIAPHHGKRKRKGWGWW